MNTFSSTENSPGILRNDYVESGLSEALRKKRKKLAETKLGDQVEDDQKEKDNAG